MSKIRNIYIVSIILVLSFILQITMPKEQVLISLALFFAFCLYLYFAKKDYQKLILVAVLACVFSFGYFNIYNLFIENTINNLSSENVKINGYITEVNTDYSFGNRYTFKIENIETKNAYDSFIYFYSQEEFNIGNQLIITGELNNNNFSSYSSYLFSKNIFGTFNVENIMNENVNKIDINILGALLKEEITYNMQKLYQGDKLSIALSMGYSDKSLVSDEILEDFSVAGISHMLVVSGLHVGIISVFLNFILKYIPINKKIKNIVLAIFLLFLAGIIGFTYSISRAVFVMIILLLLKNFKLYPDSFSSLSLIIILTVLQNPYSAFDIGLLLSYTACIGVILGARYAEKKKYNKIISAIIISGFAVLFTIPVLSFAQMKMTIISLIINPLFAILILPVSVLSFFTPILHFITILNPINEILVFINSFFINIFISFSKLISDIFSFLLIDISDGVFRGIIIVVIISALFFIISFGYNKRCKWFVFISCIIFIICYNFIGYNTVNITMIDTGRFVSSTIRYDNNFDLILKEDISEKELSYILKNENKSCFNNIIICFDEEISFDINSYANNIYNYKEKDFYDFEKYKFEITDENIFNLKSENLTITTSSYAQKVFGDGLYFLASNPPEEFYLEEIYYYQNGVLSNNFKNFIELGIGTRIYEDFKINVNLINGEYYIVKDVINFANWI